MYRPITDDILTSASGSPTDVVRKLVDCGVIEAENAGDLGRAKRRRWQDDTVTTLAHISAFRMAGLSLFQGTALRALGGSTWKCEETFSRVGPAGAQNSIDKIVRSPLTEQPGDLRIELDDGIFVYERRESSGRDLVAQLTTEGRVLALESRRARVKEFVVNYDRAVESLPIDFTPSLAADFARQHAVHAVVRTVINLDLAARAANKKLLASLGFVAA